MPDLCRELRLAQEPLPDRLVLGQTRAEELQRHVVADDHVLGAVDGAHAPGADLGFEQVAPVDRRADARGYGVPPTVTVIGSPTAS